MDNMNCCEHLMYYPNVPGHVLPCRDKLCLSCVEGIGGLMDGRVFACPLCGNYSQYVEPMKSVFGEGMPRESEKGGRNDAYNSSDGMLESEQANPDSGLGTTELASDGAECENPYDSTINALMDEKGVQFQKLKIEQKEIWDEIEKDKQFKQRSVPASPVAASATNITTPDRRSDAHKGYGSGYNDYQNGSDRKIDTHHYFDQNMPENIYNEEGLCLHHNMFITFSCKDCDDLLCEECKIKHVEEYPTHIVYRLSDLLNRGEREDSVSKCTSSPGRDAIEIATNDKKCKIHSMPYSMYCQRCQRMLCRRCHEEDHFRVCMGKPLSLRNMEHELKTKFKDYLRTTETIKNRSMEVSQTAAQCVACLHESAESLKEMVEKATQKAIEQLLENQTLMITQIDFEVKKKTAKHEICAEKANEIVKTCDEIAESAQSALKSAEDKYFDVAQVKEENIRRRVSDLDIKHLHVKPEPNEPIGLQCETEKIDRYSMYGGNKAPVRLSKSTKCGYPAASYGMSYFAYCHK